MDLLLSNFIVDNPPDETEKPTRIEGNAEDAGGSEFSMAFNVRPKTKGKNVVARKTATKKVPSSHVESEMTIETTEQGKQIPQRQLRPKLSIKVRDGSKANSTKRSTNMEFNRTAATVTTTSDVGICEMGINLGIDNDNVDNAVEDIRKVNHGGEVDLEVKKGVGYECEVKPKVEAGCRKLSRQSDSQVVRDEKGWSILDNVKIAMSKLMLPRVQPLEEEVFSEQTIDQLDIHPHTKKNLADQFSYTRLTMVQSMSILSLMRGKDVLIRAQTGSGKTLAYALPLIEQLHAVRPKISRSTGILAMVIVPTRELALQTHELMVKFLKPYSWIVSGYLCGGEKRKTEKARLRAGLNIVIGTPGRICDHIRNTEALTLTDVRWLVLDEADRLFELGYEKDVKEIVLAIQGVRINENNDVPPRTGSLQTVLLSATLSSSVKELAGLTLRDPVYVETSNTIRNRVCNVSADHLLNVDECVTIPASVQQRYVVVPRKMRLVALSGLLARELNNKPSKVIVFMATQPLVDFHYNVMIEVLTTSQVDSDNENDSGSEIGEPILVPHVTFFKLHGGMTQLERNMVFCSFRKKTAAVLLCTDMLARGIDIPSVDLVVQYHPPQQLNDYVHRVGRTGRAGQPGKAILFIVEDELNYIANLADYKIRIKEMKVDGIFVYLAQQLNCRGQKSSERKQKAMAILRNRYAEIVGKERELHFGAIRAFESWQRYYTSFPKVFKDTFIYRNAIVGHEAYALGLRERPMDFTEARNYVSKQEGFSSATNRSNPLNTVPRKQQAAPGIRGVRKRGLAGAQKGGGMGRNTGDAMAGYAARSRMLNTSEFDSGLVPIRKKARLGDRM